MKTERDDHRRARYTYPKQRPHSAQFPKNIQSIHVDIIESGVFHNHPSGDPTPSRADIDMTKTIVETARPLGITVHDHIIIGKDGHASLKGLRLI